MCGIVVINILDTILSVRRPTTDDIRGLDKSCCVKAKRHSYRATVNCSTLRERDENGPIHLTKSPKNRGPVFLSS